MKTSDVFHSIMSKVNMLRRLKPDSVTETFFYKTLTLLRWVTDMMR